MNKREADAILLACKKHSIPLTTRKEGDVYMVTFIDRIEIKSFEAAKLITNGLVVESKMKKQSSYIPKSEPPLNMKRRTKHKEKIKMGLVGVREDGRPMILCDHS